MILSNKKTLYTAIVFLSLLFSSFFFLQLKPIVTFIAVDISTSIIFILVCFLLNKIELQINEIAGIAVMFILIRLMFINTIPVGSDDIYRYMWDGKIQSNGINPYIFSPDDPRLLSFHSNILPKYLNFPHMKTIYFPLSQWMFFIGYKLSGESVWGYKLLIFFSELISIIILFGIMKHLKINLKYILIYILSPLSIIHFALDAHLDAFGFPLILASIYFYLKEKKILSAIFLGLSLSIKPIGLVILPIYFLNEKGLRDKIRILLIPFVIFFVQFLPYISAANPFEAFLIYTKNWIYNGFVFDLLNLYFRNNQTTRMICGILLALSLLPIYFSSRVIINKIYFAVLLMMIFSPIVHPWYIGWLAVLLPLTQKWSGILFAALSSLTAVTVLNYQLYGLWKDYLPVLLLEYIPVVFFLVLEFAGEYKSGINKKSGINPA